MNDKVWKTIMIALLISGVLSTSILIGYTIKLRQQCSIITYISNENQ